MEEILLNITGIIAVIVLMVTFFFNRRIQYMIHAFLILSLSAIQVLFRIGIMPYDIASIVVVKYMLTIVVVMAGRELIRSGMLEHKKGLKQASIGLGIAVIVMVVVPALADLGALSVRIPDHHWFIDSALYMIGGILLLIGAGVVKE
jgi:hypothetical protein